MGGRCDCSAMPGGCTGPFSILRCPRAWLRKGSVSKKANFKGRLDGKGSSEHFAAHGVCCPSSSFARDQCLHSQPWLCREAAGEWSRFPACGSFVLSHLELLCFLDTEVCLCSLIPVTFPYHQANESLAALPPPYVPFPHLPALGGGVASFPRN